MDVTQQEILIKFNDTFSSALIDRLLTDLDKQFGIKKIKNIDRIRAIRLKIPDNKTIEEILAKVKNLPGLKYVEPNYIASKSTVVPSDAYYSQQWGLPAVQAGQGWDYGTGSSSVIIAVVDSGVDYNHMDLKSKVILGYDAINNDYNPMDDDGHGTHVAGIIGAVSNNGAGIAGVCWNCKILAVKVLGADGRGSYSSIADGITYAADNGARVINLSLGGYSYSYVLQDAVDYANSKGVLVIAAAGNDNVDDPHYPSDCDGVISVAATDSQNRKASFSNWGSSVDVAAPGVGILSTIKGGGYDSWNGTSMAAPFVSGFAGLMFSNNPSLTAAAANKIIMDSATDLGAPGRDDYFGHGLINVYKGTCPGCYNTAPTLSWTGEPNYTADGLHPETGVQSSTAFAFRVMYTDPNGDAPQNGYPKIHLIKGGVELSGSPITMTRISGAYSSGAIYEWRNTLGISGTDFTYFFEAKDIYGAQATGMPTNSRDAPDIYLSSNALPVLSWTGETNYTVDGLHPHTGVQSTTYFSFRVKYSDANGDAPMSGYPRIHLLKGGVEISGSPIPMTYISGAHSSGSIYQWSNTLGFTGTDFTYFFEAKDNKGAVATGTPASPQDAPDVTEKPANILLVDDDEGASYETYYKAALGANGLSFHEWNVVTQGQLTSVKAAAYSTIIWFTGTDYSTTLTPTDQSVLQTFLNNGGRLFITGQEIGYDITGASFFSNTLRASYVQDDVNLYGLNGIAGDRITNGLVLGISGGDGASNQAYPDEIDPLAPAACIFRYDAAATTAAAAAQIESKKMETQDVSALGTSSSGCGGLSFDNGTYKIVYLAFGFEAVNTAATRKTLMKNTVDWLQSPNNLAPTLSWTGESNYTSDGLHPEVGYHGSTYFAFRVKYTDANGDAPMNGYPKIHLLKGGVELSGSPINMTYVSGSYASGAIYQWGNTLGISGADFSYYFEAKDTKGDTATGAPATAKNAPVIYFNGNSLPVLSWTGETNYTADGLHPESGYQGNTFFGFRVKYTDANGDAPLAGYPKIHLFKGGVELAGSPIAMSYVSGAYSTGAIYQWTNTLGMLGSDYTYYFEAKDSKGDPATGTPTGIKDAPDVTEIPASILVVDDDNGASYETYYTAALSANNLAYHMWNVAAQGELTSIKAAAYSTIIWFTGNDYSSTLTSTEQSVLQTFLNNGGRLFLTGQEIGYDITGTSFYSNYIHATYIKDNVALYALNGVSGNAITSGLSIGISGGNGASNQGFPDEIDPISPAIPILHYNPSATTAALSVQPAQKPESKDIGALGISSSGCGGLSIDNGTYKIVYLAFGFEAINTQAARNTMMQNTVTWLQAAYNIAPTLSWTGETNYTADGLHPETGTQSSTFFAFRVKYTDANGDAPMPGYPKLHLRKGGAEMAGSPITMTKISGAYSTGAIYQWSNSLGYAGTDYSYYYEAWDSKGAAATGSPTSVKDAPDVAETPAAVLLVDDDDGASYESYYRAALSANNIPFNEWNVTSQGQLTSVKAAAYSTIIWFTGNDASSTLTSTDQSVLQTFLNNGGRLFVTGQEVGYEIGSSSFFSTYLHATYVQDDVNLYGLSGVSSDAITSGLYVGISGGDGAGNQSFPDEINPISPAVSILNYDTSATTASMSALNTPKKPDAPDAGILGISSSGCGGLRVDTGAYKIVYLSFGFEAINTATSRNTLMKNVMAWLQAVPNTAPTLSWTGETNYTADGLHPETGTQSSTFFAFRVKYTDADGDAPMAGYPKLHLRKAGVELSGSPITMTYISGANSTGAIYQWSNSLGLSGSDFTYFFEAKDSKGTAATGTPVSIKDAPDIAPSSNTAPVLAWTEETNYSADGLNPETGVQGSTYFTYRVKYTDANGDAPMAGYPRLHLLKGGVELSGSPIPMTKVSGTYSTGAIYQWSNTLGISGTDFTYYFDAKDSKGATATGTPVSVKNAPDVTAGNVAPVLSWSGQTGYTSDGLEPNTGVAGVTYFDYRVKYTDANGDAPMAGYPKLHLRKGGVELAGSPITMTLSSGAPATGAIYRWANTLSISGTDFTYYYEARDSMGTAAVGSATSILDAPDISGAARVVSSMNPAGEQSLAMSLTAGWNPVSLPFDTSASDLSEIIGADAVNISKSRHEILSESVEFPAGSGIWIYSDHPRVIRIPSPESPANSGYIDAAAGWSMIGNPFPHTINLSDNMLFENKSLSQKMRLAEAVNNGWLDQPVYEYSPADELYFVKIDGQIPPQKACFIKSMVDLRIYFHDD